MIGAASDVRPNNIAIIDRAQAPRLPVRPNSLLNLAIGLMLGLMLGVLLALVLEFLDDTLKTPEDVEQKLRLPVLGIVPKLGQRQSVTEAAADLRSAFSEAYRSVRTAPATRAVSACHEPRARWSSQRKLAATYSCKSPRSLQAARLGIVQTRPPAARCGNATSPNKHPRSGSAATIPGPSAITPT